MGRLAKHFVNGRRPLGQRGEPFLPRCLREPAVQRNERQRSRVPSTATSAAASWRESAARSGCLRTRLTARSWTLSSGGTFCQPMASWSSRWIESLRMNSSISFSRKRRAIAEWHSRYAAHQTTSCGSARYSALRTSDVASASTSGSKAEESQNFNGLLAALREVHPRLRTAFQYPEAARESSGRWRRALLRRFWSA